MILAIDQGTTGTTCITFDDEGRPAGRAKWLVNEGHGDALFGTIDSWLAHKLCGEHVTDFTNASRTLLFDIRERYEPSMADSTRETLVDGWHEALARAAGNQSS